MAYINKIELLVFDLDGVFTNGTVTISESGNCFIKIPLTWYGVFRTGLSVFIIKEIDFRLKGLFGIDAFIKSIDSLSP